MIHLAIKYFIRFGQLDIPSVGQLKLLKKEAELIEGVLAIITTGAIASATSM